MPRDVFLTKGNHHLQFPDTMADEDIDRIVKRDFPDSFPKAKEPLEGSAIGRYGQGLKRGAVTNPIKAYQSLLGEGQPETPESPPGFAGRAGEFMGGLAPMAAATVGTVIGGPVVAPLLTAGVLAHYAAVGAGDMERHVENWQRENGEELSTARRATLATLAGVATSASSFLGLKGNMEAMRTITPGMLDLIQRSLAKGEMQKVAGAFAKLGFIQGGQAVVQQAAFNTLSRAGFDETQKLSEGLGAAAVGGFTAGIVMGPFGALGRKGELAKSGKIVKLDDPMTTVPEGSTNKRNVAPIVEAPTRPVVKRKKGARADERKAQALLQQLDDADVWNARDETKITSKVGRLDATTDELTKREMTIATPHKDRPLHNTKVLLDEDIQPLEASRIKTAVTYLAEQAPDVMADLNTIHVLSMEMPQGKGKNVVFGMFNKEKPGQIEVYVYPESSLLQAKFPTKTGLYTSVVAHEGFHNATKGQFKGPEIERQAGAFQLGTTEKFGENAQGEIQFQHKYPINANTLAEWKRVFGDDPETLNSLFALRALIKDVKLKIKDSDVTRKTRRVRVPRSQSNNYLQEINSTIVDGSGIRKIDFERAATAVKYITEVYPDINTLVGNVRLIDDGKWSSEMTQRYSQYSPKEMAMYQSAAALYDGAHQLVLVRADASLTSVDYINNIAHEFDHSYQLDTAGPEGYRKLFPRDQPWASKPGEKLAVKRSVDAIQDLTLHGRSSLIFQYANEGIRVPQERIVAVVEQFRKAGVPVKGGFFLHNEQLFDPRTGAEVNAFYDPNTDSMHFSKFVDIDTVGHEFVEHFISKLGYNHRVLQKGIKLFGGKEQLADAVGRVDAGVLKNKTMVDRVNSWLDDFWTSVRVARGKEVTGEEVARVINRNMMDKWAYASTEAGYMPTQYQLKAKHGTGADIDGNKYQAGTLSGIKNSKETNYVVFDPKEITIEKKVEFQTRDRNYEKQVHKDTEKYVSSTNITGLTENHVNLIRLALFDQNNPHRTMTQWDTDAYATLRDANEVKSIVNKALSDKALTPVEARALSILGEQATVEMAKIFGGTDIEPSIQSAMWRDYMAIATAKDKAGNMAGATLRMFHQAADNYLQMALMKLPNGLRPDQQRRIDRAAASGDPRQKLDAVMSIIENPTVQDYVKSAWYSGVMSGFPTLFVNFLNNTMWGAAQVPHRGAQALADMVYCGLTGKQRTYFLEEMLPLFNGWKGGAKRGLLEMKEVIKTGEVGEYESKMFYEVGAPVMLAFERSPHEILRKAAPFVNWSSRVMRGCDVLAKVMASDGELQAMAVRRALQAGKKKGTQEFADFVNTYLGKVPDADLESCKRFAEYSTFTDKLDSFSSSLQQARNAVPGGWLALPFIRTIANITKRGLEMTPVIGAAIPTISHHHAMQRLHKQANLAGVPWNKNPPTSLKVPKFDAPDIIAKQIEGTIITGVVLSMFGDGSVTGDVPEDPSERDAFYRQGKLPWSLKVGDTWYSYRRFEPINLLLSTLAVAKTEIEGAKDGEEATKIFENAAYSVFHNFLSSTYTSNMLDLADQHSAIRMAERIPASFVPYSSFWRSLGRTYEAVTEGEVHAKDTKGMMNQLANVLYFIPGVPAPENRMNDFGDPVVIPGGVFEQWLPYKRAQASTDPLELELERLKVYPSIPDRKIKGVEIPDALYRDYAFQYGQATKAALSLAITKGSYARAKDDQHRVDLLDRSMRRARLNVRRKVERAMKSAGLMTDSRQN